MALLLFTGTKVELSAAMMALSTRGRVAIEWAHEVPRRSEPQTEKEKPVATSLIEQPKASRKHSKKPQQQGPAAVETTVAPLPEQAPTVLAVTPAVEEPAQEQLTLPATPKPPGGLTGKTEFAYKGYVLLASGRAAWSVHRKDGELVEHDGKREFPLLVAKQIVNADLK